LAFLIDFRLLTIAALTEPRHMKNLETYHYTREKQEILVRGKTREQDN